MAVDRTMETPAAASPSRFGSPAPSIVSPTLLGLYVILLAFFILLGSISQRSEGRVRAVIDGIHNTFNSESAAETGDTALGEREGEAPSPGFLAEMGRLTATAFPLARVEQVYGSRRLQATVAVVDMFRAETAELTPSGVNLLRQIAQAMATRPSGRRYDVEFIMVGGDGEQQRALAVARATAFVEALLAAGASRDSVAIGLAPGDARVAALRFFVRPANEGRVDLREAKRLGGGA